MKVYICEKLKEVTVRPQKTLYAGNPPVQVGSERRVFAQFRRGGLPSWAHDQALPVFKMGAKPEGVSAERWLAYYDPAEGQRENKWTDEEVALIEERLARTPGVILVQPQKAAAPYAKYDQHRKVQGRRTIEKVIEDITAVFESAGFDVGHAITYEKQNGNDPAVIAALEALAAPTEQVEDELVAA